MKTFNINKSLKKSLDREAKAYELDSSIFLHDPTKIQEERKEFVLNNPFPIPDTIGVQDIFIPSSKEDYSIRLHVYQSKQYNPNHVLLYFHGGGYVFGLPEQVDEQMFYLAEKLDATIVSVDYKLSPQYKFPAPINDGLDAFKWLIEKGEEILGINPTNISLYGGSAGGHLAGLVSQLAKIEGYKQIKHQFLLYPVINFRLDTNSMNDQLDAPLWNKTYAEISKQHFFGKEQIKKDSCLADLDQYKEIHLLPRTTLVACEFDPLRDEAINYAIKLYKADVPTELWVVPGAVHIFDLFESDLIEQFYSFLLNRLKSGFTQ
ncbi:alpha/beta hydrolase [Sphingobacterium lactis]|uniref:alpha/beta hydrolase n=1 Tax=Sphingobacterium lactis TaxID=797291 RepID=UPI003F7CDD7D